MALWSRVLYCVPQGKSAIAPRTVAPVAPPKPLEEEEEGLDFEDLIEIPLASGACAVCSATVFALQSVGGRQDALCLVWIARI
jgi:hypothetical protein